MSASALAEGGKICEPLGVWPADSPSSFLEHPFQTHSSSYIAIDPSGVVHEVFCGSHADTLLSFTSVAVISRCSHLSTIF